MIDIKESRYDRAERITWWEQSKLTNSRVLVVGAGALGNEVVKNLTLVGVGEIHIVDMDTIEHSNLSRCVFFRDGDEGQYKAALLANRATELNPTISLVAHTVKVQALGNHYISNFDLVIGALDNREARLWVSRSSRINRVPFIDAAIEGLHAVVRIFQPEGPCYACTLGEVDWQVLNKRRACSLLEREDIAEGKTPTNATTSSIAAAIQCQEAIKILVARDDLVNLNGKAWHLMGESMATFTVEFSENPDCLEHISAPDEIEFISSLTEIEKYIQNPESGEGAIWVADDVALVQPCATCKDAALLSIGGLLSAQDILCKMCSTEKPMETFSIMNSHWERIKEMSPEVRWPISEYLFMDSSDGNSKAIVLQGERA